VPQRPEPPAGLSEKCPGKILCHTSEERWSAKVILVDEDCQAGKGEPGKGMGTNLKQDAINLKIPDGYADSSESKQQYSGEFDASREKENGP
jgi:hypothetical protein